MSEEYYTNNSPDSITSDFQTSAIISRLSNDFVFFAAAVLKIVDKSGNLIPLLLNKTQKELLAKIIKLERAKKPIRLIIVKARQLGMSTFIAAYYFWKIMTQKHISGLIVCDEIQDAQSLLAKAHVFYDNLVEVLKPPKKYRSKKELYFENLNSSLQIDTASNSSLGRSRTFQLIHLSEIAYYPGEGKEALLSLRQTVADKPNTSIILESTANGLDNIFYDEVQRALRQESEYEVVFFPWYGNIEYTLGEELEFELLEEEKELKKQYNLTWGQMRWRKRTIIDNCQNSLDLFKQEYPCNLEEAFRYTGHPVFDLSQLIDQSRIAPIPLFTGNYNPVTEEMNEHKEGKLKIWEYAKEDETYIIGIDVAMGKENEDLKRDFSVITVINANTKEQCLEYRSQETTDIIGTIAVGLAKKYNKAYMVIESNSYGTAVINKVRDLHYPYLYKERDYKETGHERQERIGFSTTNSSKPMLISFFAEMFRDGFIKLNSRTLMDEMSKFSQDTNGRLQASIGHDDCVISAALAIWGLRYAPILRKITVIEEEVKYLPTMGNWDKYFNPRKPEGLETDWIQKSFKNSLPPRGFN